MKIEKITYRKQVRWITTGTAESWTEPAFMKFVRSTIQTLPHRWAVKDNTHKKYQFEKVWNQFKERSEPTDLDQWAS